MSNANKNLFSAIAQSTAAAPVAATEAKGPWKHEVWVGTSKEFAGKFCIGGANKIVLPLETIIGEWGADPVKVAAHLGIYPHRSMTVEQCNQLKAALGIVDAPAAPAPVVPTATAPAKSKGKKTELVAAAPATEAPTEPTAADMMKMMVAMLAKMQ